MSSAVGAGGRARGGGWFGWAVWGVIAVLSVGNAVYGYRYLPRIGVLAFSVMANPFARPWLDIHIAGAATALLVGWVQFVGRVRARWPSVHRWVGRVYMVGCLVGGVGGLVMAVGSTAGPVASVGFGGLAVAWIAANAMGWVRARERRFGEHRGWMIRSWALTLAAVTLRIYFPLALIAGLPALSSYRAISFLCWVPNLLVAEIYLWGSKQSFFEKKDQKTFAS